MAAAWRGAAGSRLHGQNAAGSQVHSRASAQLVVHVAPVQWRWHVASVLHSTLHAAPVHVMSHVAPSLQTMSQRLEEHVIAQAPPAGHAQTPVSGHVISCCVVVPVVAVPPPAPELTVQSSAHPPWSHAEAVRRATQSPVFFVRMEGAWCTPRATSCTQQPTLPQLALLRSRRPMVPFRHMASWKHPRRSDRRTSREGAIRGLRGPFARGARVIAAALLVAGALVVPAPSARADDTKDAREAYDRGARAFGQGSYAVAATEFSRADELGPTPAALKAAILAEDPVLAMSLVDRADARAPNASVAAQVARARDRFSDKVARLKITCAAACSAKVGQEPTQVGASRYYRAGNYVIEITTTGAPEIFAVQLPGGTNMEWKPPPKALPAEPTASSVPSSAPSTAPVTPPTSSVTATATVATAAPTSAPLAPRATTLSPAWFAVGLGVTAVAGGLTIGFGLDTLSKHDAFLIHRTEDGASAGQDAQLRTNVLVGVTAAAAVATAVIGYFAFRSSSDGSHAPSTGHAGPGGARPLRTATLSSSPASPLIVGAFTDRTRSAAE